MLVTYTNESKYILNITYKWKTMQAYKTPNLCIYTYNHAKIVATRLQHVKRELALTESIIKTHY